MRMLFEDCDHTRDIANQLIGRRSAGHSGIIIPNSGKIGLRLPRPKDGGPRHCRAFRSSDAENLRYRPKNSVPHRAMRCLDRYPCAIGGVVRHATTVGGRSFLDRHQEGLPLQPRHVRGFSPFAKFIMPDRRREWSQSFALQQPSLRRGGRVPRRRRRRSTSLARRWLNKR